MPISGSKILSLTLCKAVRNAQVQHIFHATIVSTCLAMRMSLQKESQIRKKRMPLYAWGPIMRKRPLALQTTCKLCEHRGQFPNKKVRETEVSRTIADFQAPLWEAPNGPPGGHFRAEEASPENIEPSLGQAWLPRALRQRLC